MATTREEAAPAPAKKAGTGQLRRGLTLEERQAARRAALMDAAIELFGTKGYADTAVKDVCQLAYVSPRDYYELFENREDLLVAVGAEVQTRVFASFAETFGVSKKRRPLDRVLEAMLAAVRALTDDPRLGRIAYIETVSVARVQERLRRPAIREFADGLAELLADDLAKAGLDRRHGHAVAIAMIGGANELLSDWMLGDRDGDRSIDELLSLIEDTLRAMFPGPKRMATSRPTS